MAVLPRNFTLLQVIPDLDTGGAEQTTLDVARAVVEAGGRAIVASRGGRMAAELAARGGELVNAPVQTKNPLVMLANRPRLARLIEDENVGLVHVRSRAPAFAAFAAAKDAGVPCIATYHGLYGSGNPLKRWYNSVMTRGPITIANSDFTARHVVAEHHVAPARVVAIPRGVDLDRFDTARVAPERVAALEAAWGVGPADRRTRFLHAGRLTRWKGQMLSVEAAERLLAAGRTDFLIVMVGDDQGRSGYGEELAKEIVRRGAAGHVVVAGHCDDMPAAYLAADVALAPSLDPEAFGRTAVEPQAMGRPVIAADHGAPAESVLAGETGWLVRPGDAAGVADAMAEAMGVGAARRAAMGAVGMARARRLFSVEAMCEATLQVYANVLENSVGGPKAA
jgi:glycosyltransferase involved in cell wall biosynthesis